MADCNNDKPFVCNEKGCQMKFSNIDHLAVHQKRHEMRLKFSTSREAFQIADQTPTPSRILGSFLQNWEEVGLSQEIQEISNLTPILNDSNKSNNANITTKSNSNGDNPFAASFQNALMNNNKSILKSPELLSRAITDSPLNTPSVFPCNEGLMAIANAALNTPDPDYRYPELISEEKTSNNSAIIIDNSLSSQSSNSSYIDATPASVSVNDNSDTSSGRSDEQINETNVMKPQKFQAVSVICNAATNLINSTPISQTIPNIVISQSNNKIRPNTKLRTVPIAQASKNAAIIAPKTKESSITIGNTSSLYKVILKLPDGRSVQLPLVQQPLTQTSIVSSAAQSITAINNSSKTNVNNITNNETIHITNKISIGATSSSSSQPIQTSGTSLSSLQSKVDATLASLPPKAKPGRKSKFAPEEDPKEKKARSLERNRAAAMRCRLKRKHWIDSLEEKADEYEKINEKLQSEVVALRREVTLLKTALLAHKDCPVTLQQQKVTNPLPESCTTSVTAVMTVPNGNSHENGIETNGTT